MPSPAPRYLALAGPTASGKTDAALALAGALGAEIVSVDSALVYRGMDIGTAKPTRAQLAAVPHHLIDIRDPSQPYSAADFVADARRAIDAITARGRLPLLVGGTMLYFKALVDGLSELPPADAAIREEIERDAAARGWAALHEDLRGIDPQAAGRLAPRDAQRIQRALEVFRLTGRPLSAFHGAAHAGGLPPVALLSLEPVERTWLHERIAQRTDAMLRAGLLDEVQALRARGDLDAALPSMRSVGYRQAWEALDGDWPMAELRDRIVFATRQLAKRQLTWLRGMQRRVVACDAAGAQQQLLAAAHEALA